jgi:hypothetical protein
MRKTTWWLAATGLFALVVNAAAAQSPSFTLDVLAPASQEVSLAVPPSGSVPVRIMRSGAPVPGGLVDLSLSEFIGEQGISVAVLLTVDDTTLPARTTQAGVPFPGPLLPIHLQVPPLPTAGKYTGTLVLTIPGQESGSVWRFKLTSAQESRPATLVLDQGPVTLSAVRALCLRSARRMCLGRDEEPAVTVHVRDKAGLWPLEGITARLEPGLKAPGHGFDSERDMRITINGQLVSDFFASPPTGSRSVSAREQATVRLVFRNLEAGEYTIPFRFAAMNSGLDDLQRLTVTIQVRDGLGWAVIVLMLASLLSFVATRVVSTLRLRAAFLERVRVMRPAWLAQEPPVLPVIWLRAMVRQAEDLSRRFWLTSQAEIDARLTQAAGMLSVLDRVRQVRARLQQHLHEVPIRRRSLWALDRTLRQIDAGPLSDQQLAQIKADLDALEAWADPTKKEASYWADLLLVIQGLLSEIHIEEVPGNGQAGVRQLIQVLRDAMTPPPAGAPPPPPLTLDQKIALEEQYQRLRLLWDLRGAPGPFAQVVALQQAVPPGPIEGVFRVIDGAAWSRLQAQSGKPSVEGPPPNSLDPVEAYAPVTFRLATPGDPDLQGTYLVQRKLTYTWVIEIKGGRWRWKGLLPSRQLEPVGELRVTSAEPQVAQYSPRAGEIAVREVQIRYGGTPGPQVRPSSPVTVRKSKDFRMWQIAAGADILALVVAGIFGLVSGLLIYAQAPTFGALKDYLSLFTWAAGLDQGKNFLQALGSRAAPKA